MISVHENGFLLVDVAKEDDRANVCLVLLILNSDAVNEALVRLLWDRVDLRVCADGGTNRLFDLSTEAERAAGLLLPDFIKGDLDSIRRTDVLPHYANAGVPVLEDSSQDDTDLEKCLGEVRRLCEAPGRTSSLHIDPARLRALQRPLSSVTVLVVGGFDGAFHHDLGNVHALHRHAHLFGRLLLLGRSCVAELLLGPEQLLAQERYHQQRWQRALAWRTDAEVASEPEAVTGAVGTGCSSSEIDACSPPTTAAAGDVARHELSLYRGVEGPTCGLYPLQGRCERVRSEGLRWNLEGVSLEFGHFISTSNRIMSYGDGGMGSGRVVVEVSHTLLWTHEYTLSHHPQPVQRNATAIIT